MNVNRMKIQDTIKERTTHLDHHKGRGPSSFWMHDPEKIFKTLALEKGETVADLGCGPGDYSLAIVRLIGPTGSVVAMDRWQGLLDKLAEKASNQGVKNIEVITTNITEILPLKERSIDCCLLSTVLHSLSLAVASSSLFPEILRVLKVPGRLVIIECKKEEQNFGPPKHLRISPQELEAALYPFGFSRTNYQDLGYTYLIQFEVESLIPLSKKK